MVASVEREAEVDENGGFNDGDEDDWEGDAASDEHDDNKDGNDRNDVNNLEVMRSEIDHILGEAGLAN